MANTYVALAKSTPSGVATVSLSAIPQTYTDLVLTISFRDNQGAGNFTDYVYVQVNGSTTTHTLTNLQGNSSATSSTRYTTGTYWFARSDAGGNTTNTFSSHEFYIANYANGNYKSACYTGVVEGNSTTAGNTYIQPNADLWSTTSAITSLTVGSLNSTFANGTRIDLYGIKSS
jgi:hypothetical protein